MENRIKQLREEHHMTQIRLSVALEVSQETISAYESGKHYPSVTSLLKLSHIFHVSCDYILGLTDCRYPLQSQPYSSKEQLLISKWNLLNEHQQELLIAYLDGLLQNRLTDNRNN